MLRIFVNVEIRGTFGKEKKKEQESRRISAVEWTTLLLRIWKVWSSVLCPESNFVGRLFTGFLSNCRAVFLNLCETAAW
jgi:hypothetical protein